jgi:LysM repeat protein
MAKTNFNDVLKIALQLFTGGITPASIALAPIALNLFKNTYSTLSNPTVLEKKAKPRAVAEQPSSKRSLLPPAYKTLPLVDYLPTSTKSYVDSLAKPKLGPSLYEEGYSRKGSSLQSIADEFDIDPRQLQRWNPEVNFQNLPENTKVRLPKVDGKI